MVWITVRVGREEAGLNPGACSQVWKGRAPSREDRERGLVLLVGTAGREGFQEHVLRGPEKTEDPT